MSRSAKQFVLLLLVLALTPAAAPAAPAELRLRPGDRVAICGDSITEQRVYSVFIQDYLLMCQPKPKLETIQFGWGGDTSWEFAKRVERQVLPFKPTVATISYGMNDGGYAALTPERASNYRQAMTDIARRFQGAGVRVVLGSSGCVDTHYFDIRYHPGHAEVYNKALASLRDIAREVASEQGCAFVDMYGLMSDVQARAKAKFGPEYPVAGSDGFHPTANGHLVMAYAYLKALGCDGEIGTITADVGSKQASASEGHEVVSFDGMSLTVTSRRYPFCFFGYPGPNGDPRSPYSTQAIIEFFPFNEDLNRFRLVVRGLPEGNAKVTWGDAAKQFTSAQLTEGINLAAEFLDNPFCEPFKAVERSARGQQDYEFSMVRYLLQGAQLCLAGDEPLQTQILNAVSQRRQELAEASSAAVVPVTHVIRIEPVARSNRPSTEGSHP